MSIRSVMVLSLFCILLPALQAQQAEPAKPTTLFAPVGDVKTTHTGLPEDWSVPQLPANRGAHIDAEVIEKDGHPTFTRELVRVEWRTGDGIDLWIIKPTAVKKPPVILYLYSFPSTTERYQDLDLCKSLTDRGIAAVGLVSALTGQRYHDRPQKEWFISELQEALGSSVHDVQMILDYLAERGDLDMTRVGMWGDGSGASIAIIAAAVDPRIRVLDLLDPWGDWPDWIAKSSLIPENERADYLKPEFLKKLENLDPVEWISRLNKTRVRLQYIKDGVTVTPAIAKERVETAAPANVKIVHYQNKKEFLEQVAFTGKGFDWITEQVKSPGSGEGQSAQKAESSPRAGSSDPKVAGASHANAGSNSN